jgi:hypothetical protein
MARAILKNAIGAMKDSVLDALDTDNSASGVVTRSGLELRPPSSREVLGKLPAGEDVSVSVCAEGCGDKDQRRLDRQFDRLNEHLPGVVGERIVWLRKPSSRWVRLPIAILLIVASVFSFLPVLGLWMLPLGLMLLAADVPFLKRPTGLALFWLERQWRTLAGWYRGRNKQIARSNPPAGE